MNDYNQDYQPEPLAHDLRERKIAALTRMLASIPIELYKVLSEPSCGVIDPHFAARRRAAERMARILIPPK
jgi:hypothetical protein